MKNRYLLSLLCMPMFWLGGAVITLSAPVVEAQEQAASEKKTRRTPALRSKVYEQLSRAQAEGDAGRVPDAIAILDEVKSKASSMNSYELAMMHNFYGFIYYNSEDYDNAILSFENAVAQQPIPLAFEQTTLFSLAQLHMMQGNYEKSIASLEQWEALQQGPIPAKNNVLKAQAYYQNKDYDNAGKHIEAAIAEHESEGYTPDEGWLILQRAIYYERKQPELVKEILAKMIRLYDKPKYWIQLAGMYGELGQEKRQLAMMETAYQMGFIESGADLFNLAQLYYYHDIPYKAARLMEQGVKDGVLEANLRNLKFLAQCWQGAKENTKAIPVLQDAAQLADNGELDAQLAHLFYNTERYQDAITAAQSALSKGGLANPGNTHLVLGLSLYNQKSFALALDELAKAESFPASRGTAQQWGKYVSKEKRDFEIMQASLAGE